MEAQKAADHVAWLKAKGEREEAAKQAQEAAKAAALVSVATRRAADLKAREEHAAQMAEKKRIFEENFRNVWGVSQTGLSIATVNLPTKLAADSIISKLFEKTLIADVHSFSSVTKCYKKSLAGLAGTNAVRETVQRLTAITSDDRVAQLIEEVVD